MIGGANIDIKCRIGGTHTPFTSNPGTVETSSGGVAFNIARNLALLGERVALVSAIGRDEAGRRLFREAHSAGIDLSRCRRSAFATGAYVALLDRRGELISAVSAMSIMDELTPTALRGFVPALRPCELVVADCNLPRDSLRFVLNAAKHGKRRVMVDGVSVAKVRRLRPLIAERLPIFALSLNRAEAVALDPGLRNTMPGLRAFARHLHLAGVDNVLIHLGRRGVFVSARGSDGGPRISRRIAARKSRREDVTGAGDAALAATAYGVLRRLDIFAAAELGQVAAAMTLASAESVSEAMTGHALIKKMAR